MLWPPMAMAVSVTNEVASFAPARQTFPNGTTSPKIFRPFICGLEYATLMVLPSGNLQLACAGGLGRCALSCGAASGDVEAIAMLRKKAVRFAARICIF